MPAIVGVIVAIKEAINLFQALKKLSKEQKQKQKKDSSN